MPAGNYSSHLLWLVVGPNSYRDATNGEQRLVYVTNGYLWASVEEVAGRRQTEYGAEQTGADVEIRLGQYPNVTTDDLLRDEFDNTYHIDSIRFGSNELILDCYRHDTLVDWEEEEGS